MVEKHAVATLLRASRGDAAVLLATFFLTIFRDLTEAIVVGFALGSGTVHPAHVADHSG
jgi:SulP family sulfate permease